MNNKRYLLFDLDGTITEPKEGITRSVAYALSFYGINEDNMDNLTDYIGPPLVDSFQEFHGLTSFQAAEAVEKYRERFREKGIYENAVIEGIMPLLEELDNSGRVILLATSKPQEFADKIMENFGFAPHFKIIRGSGMNGERKTKADVIEAVFDELADKFISGELDVKENSELEKLLNDMKSGIQISKTDIINNLKADAVMIGDRHHDIDGARECKIESIGVRFGYAKENELENAGADEIVDTVRQLRDLLMGEA